MTSCLHMMVANFSNLLVLLCMYKNFDGLNVNYQIITTLRQFFPIYLQSKGRPLALIRAASLLPLTPQIDLHNFLANYLS